MSGAMRVLIETILKMYDSLSSRTLALMREIAERQRVEQSLRLSKNVIDSTLEAIFVTDEALRIIDTNPSFCQEVMREHRELTGMSVMDVMPTLFSPDKTEEILRAVHQNGHWTGEIIGRNNEGELEAVWLTLSAIKDPQGATTQFVGLLSSVSQLLERHQGLVEAANHDTLTGLPNRRLLQDRISQAITRSDRSRNMLAICFLDLDGFKQINDTLGHDAGDEVLRSVAARLVNALRGDDTVARIGGDEFVLLFGEVEGEQDMVPLLERLLKDIARPVSTGDHTVSVTASIGVTFYPKDEHSAAELLQHADAAMYLAKNNGKSQYRLYQPMP
jgi:diguanylate cyclase (GGDEF)-like protein/PAS domain S-box-containing protein